MAQQIDPLLFATEDDFCRTLSDEYSAISDNPMEKEKHSTGDLQAIVPSGAGQKAREQASDQDQPSARVQVEKCGQ